MGHFLISHGTLSSHGTFLYFRKILLNVFFMSIHVFIAICFAILCMINITNQLIISLLAFDFYEWGAFALVRNENVCSKSNMESYNWLNKIISTFPVTCLKKIRVIIQSLYLPVTDVEERETESRYLAYLSIAINLDALRLLLVLPTFCNHLTITILLQSYLLTMNQIKSKNFNFHTFFYTQAYKQTKWYPYDSYIV